ncbi:hypothetical protein RND71_031073 [Anisodus tanguticus]|uniref:DUF4283 domain-containing protein n=1 Tax=Anisodus tanguticus TaxID=243964 RepID=A0AAE1RBU2_9SOLA|nr:hypothetical protein RND71_031073 [Anisodus tanguticus]
MVAHEELEFIVVAKFSYEFPDFQGLSNSIPTQCELKGRVQVGLLCNRHILIRCSMLEDYVALLSKPIWQIKEKNQFHPMRTFKWETWFNPDEETSTAMAWISFLGLPPSFFGESTLFSLASAVGKPISIDAATRNKTRPSCAKVKVEVDLLKEHPKQIQIHVAKGKEIQSKWFPIRYDYLPKYYEEGGSSRQGNDCAVVVGVAETTVEAVDAIVIVDHVAGATSGAAALSATEAKTVVVAGIVDVAAFVTRRVADAGVVGVTISTGVGVVVNALAVVIPIDISATMVANGARQVVAGATADDLPVRLGGTAAFVQAVLLVESPVSLPVSLLRRSSYDAGCRCNMPGLIDVGAEAADVTRVAAGAAADIGEADTGLAVASDVEHVETEVADAEDVVVSAFLVFFGRCFGLGVGVVFLVQPVLPMS